MRAEQGFSLIELMVGLVVSGILLSALLQYTAHQRQQFAVTSQQILAQSDLQGITDLLRHSIRHAGFTPCLGLDWLAVVDKRGNKLVAPAVQSQANQLHITRMSSRFSRLMRVIDRQVILADNTVQFKPKQSILIADCVHAEIHRITAVAKTSHWQRLTLHGPLTVTFSQSATVGRWLEERFYVQDKRFIYHLFHEETLSDHIDSLQVENTGKLVTVTINRPDQPPWIIQTRMRMP